MLANCKWSDTGLNKRLNQIEYLVKLLRQSDTLTPENWEKIRVAWDYYPCEPNDCTDIEVDDNATEDEIERAVKEAALQHFEWSWWEIENTKN